jgi:hypothetical protein
MQNSNQIIINDKILLNNPFQIDIDGISFTGTEIGIDSIHLYKSQINIALRPGQVNNAFNGMLTFQKSDLSDDQVKTISDFSDIIKSIVKNKIDTALNQTEIPETSENT